MLLRQSMACMQESHAQSLPVSAGYGFSTALHVPLLARCMRAPSHLSGSVVQGLGDVLSAGSSTRIVVAGNKGVRGIHTVARVGPGQVVLQWEQWHGEAFVCNKA